MADYAWFYDKSVITCITLNDLNLNISYSRSAPGVGLTRFFSSESLKTDF